MVNNTLFVDEGINMAPVLCGICNLARKSDMKGKYLEIVVKPYGMYRLWLDVTRIKFHSSPTADIKYIMLNHSSTVIKIISGRSIKFASL